MEVVTLTRVAPEAKCAVVRATCLLVWVSACSGGQRHGRLYLHAFDSAKGVAEGAEIPVDLKGNRYHEMVSSPDGSVAFVAPGSSATKLETPRVLPCAG